LSDDSFYFLESEQHEILSKNLPTCILALSNDQVDDIIRLCETYLQPFSNKAVLQYMGSNLILLINIEEFRIFTSLTNSTVVQSDCSACLKTVPCGSKIQAASLMILIPNCPSLGVGKDTDVSAHMVNLQVLGPLLDFDVLRELSAEFTFHCPVNVSLPNLTVFQPQEDQKLSEAFRTLGLHTIHLTSAITKTLQKRLIFQTPAEHVIYKLSEEGLAYKTSWSWESFKSWISYPFEYVQKILTVLECAAIGYLFYRVHVLGMLLFLGPRAGMTLKTANLSQVHKLEEIFNL